MDVASSVYLVMDRSMLGYITGDDGEVGLYAAAIKIASVLTSFYGYLVHYATANCIYAGTGSRAG